MTKQRKKAGAGHVSTRTLQSTTREMTALPAMTQRTIHRVSQAISDGGAALRFQPDSVKPHSGE